MTEKWNPSDADDLGMVDSGDSLIGAAHGEVEKLLSKLAQAGPLEIGGTQLSRIPGLTNRLPRDVGEGSWDFMRVSQNLILSRTKADYARRSWIDVPAQETLKIRIVLEGRLCDQAGSTIVEGPGACIEAIPRMASGGYFVEPGRLLMLVLHIRPEELLQFFGIDASAFPSPIDELFKDSLDCESVARRVRLGPDVLRSANDLLAGFKQYPPELFRAFLDAKSHELLCSIVRDCLRLGDNRFGDMTLTVRDINRVYEARDLLLENYVQPPTIAQLSRSVAINQTKLKAAFKAVFGQTVFEFVRKCKMDRAVELLLNTDDSIAEIAYAVGYEYPSNFTHAFKRDFGYLPNQLRKNASED